MDKQWKQWLTILEDTKITADGDCNHEIKRRLLLGRKVMTNLDSILKSRDITLPTKFHLYKAMVFPVVMYGCESWTIKKAERWRIDAFELWCWRRLLRVPWIARRSNQSILKEISSGCSLEGLMLKLKLQYLGHLMRRADSFDKTLMLGKIEGRRRRGQQRMKWWMTSPTHSRWVWVNSGWWTGTPGVLQSMGSQRVGQDWVTELNWCWVHLFIAVISCGLIPSSLCSVFVSCNSLEVYFAWIKYCCLAYFRLLLHGIPFSIPSLSFSMCL